MNTSRIIGTMTMTLAAALASGCDWPGKTSGSAASGGRAAATRWPTRKAGLWEQTMTRDGKPARIATMRVCLDPATDAKVSFFGRRAARGDCQRQITPLAKGVYRFASTCKLGAGATMSAQGTLSGDFASRYQVHSQMTVTGAPYPPLDGSHVMDVEGRYLGACPSGMAPGEVAVGHGMTFNIDKLPRLAEALDGA